MKIRVQRLGVWDQVLKVGFKNWGREHMRLYGGYRGPIPIKDFYGDAYQMVLRNSRRSAVPGPTTHKESMLIMRQRSVANSS